MRNLYSKSLTAFFVMSVLVLSAAVPAYCEEADNVVREDVGEYLPPKSVEGTVVAIDADGGVIAVRPVDAVDLNNDQVTIQIDPDTEVYKGGGTIKSSDIQIGDIVTVDFLDDASGLRAKVVTVQ